ncbi:hypothetical protein BXY57_0618 [Thermoflavifilum aggregans]|uniref:Uncharacterized protein n=1 Tax=Thermoflavifilum aggregans TaxID=454188 RepID=A0A2M9CSY9_9BACT|nr:hypothetical protein [Thermoflavifilum aggregans]PJJ75050.1 hypothetical protein BXY57_0618 [Thermoflavifilum aggregans]
MIKQSFILKKNKKWVIIDLFDIRPSNGNAAEDARNDWNEIVAPNYVVKNDISTEFQEIDSWQLTAQSVTTSGILKFNVSLITFSCSYGHASILLVNNDFQNILDGPITDFISSLKVVSPQEALAYIKPSNNANVPFANTQLPGSQSQSSINQNNNDNNNASTNNIVSAVSANPYNPPFPTPGEQPVKASIMMDVGWFVEATNDYIQYTKKDIKVIQYFFVAPQNPNSNTPDEDLFWQKYLNQYFSTDTYNKYPNDPYDFLNRIAFASCNAVYRGDGKTYFIAWMVSNYCSYLAITSSEQVYNSYFKHPNELAGMERFNNFPVTTQEIQGKWVSTSFAGAQMYSSITGYYAGMAVATSATSFEFSGNMFNKSTQGATGMVGSMQTFSSETKGTFKVNDYTLVTTEVGSEPDAKEYYCAFKYAKNAKILFLQDKKYSGMTYYLIKK